MKDELKALLRRRVRVSWVSNKRGTRSVRNVWRGVLGMSKAVCGDGDGDEGRSTTPPSPAYASRRTTTTLIAGNSAKIGAALAMPRRNTPRTPKRRHMRGNSAAWNTPLPAPTSASHVPMWCGASPSPPNAVGVA